MTTRTLTTRTLLIPDHIWTSRPSVLTNFARLSRHGARFQLQPGHAVVTLHVDEDDVERIDVMLANLDRELAIEVV